MVALSLLVAPDKPVDPRRAMFDDIIKVARVKDILTMQLVPASVSAEPMNAAFMLSFDLWTPMSTLDLPPWLRWLVRAVMEDYMQGTRAFANIRFRGKPIINQIQYGIGMTQTHVYLFLDSLVAAMMFYYDTGARDWTDIMNWWETGGLATLREMPYQQLQ